MSKSEERENEERDSSRSENHSFDWLEQLAGEPDALWDKVASSEDLVMDSPVAESQEIDKEIAASNGNHDLTSGEDNGPVHDKAALEQTVEQADIAGTEQQLDSVRNRHADMLREVVVQPESETRHESVEDKPNPGAVNEGRIDSIVIDQGLSGEAGKVFGRDEETSEVVDFGIEIDLESDDLMWLDDMETVSDMNVNPQDNDEMQPAESHDDSAGHQFKEQGEGEIVAMAPANVDSDQVPEDPDEAIAWLERLAAKQGAPSEELPTVKSTVSFAVEELAPIDPEVGNSYEDTGEIPEDPDEAMAWLERLAARQGADAEELTSVETVAEVAGPGPTAELEDEVVVEPLQSSLSGDLDEALGWLEELTVPQEPTEEAPEDLTPITVNEELPTPAVAHDVEEALTGAELLFAEPASAALTETDDEPFDESQIEDADDAMAWLEQLAARQGAPIEELTTVDSDPDAGQASADTDIDPIADAEDQLDAQDVVKVEEPVAELLTAPPLGKAPVADELPDEPAGEPEMATDGAPNEIGEADAVGEGYEIAAPDTIAAELAPDAWLITNGSDRV